MAARFGLFVDKGHSKLHTFTGYLNFINGPTNRVLLLILVHVQLLSCLFFCLLASLRLKTMSLNIAQQFMKEMVKFWSIKNPGEILNKLKSRGFLVCLHMISLLSILHCLII